MSKILNKIHDISLEEIPYKQQKQTKKLINIKYQPREFQKCNRENAYNPNKNKSFFFSFLRVHIFRERKLRQKLI